MADSNQTLRITNKAREGYRRCGVTFARGVNEMSSAAFNKDQLATLNADPHLTVEPVKAAPAQGSVADGDMDGTVKPRANKSKEKKR